MPRLDPATRNIAIGRLQAGESQNEVARTLNREPNIMNRHLKFTFKKSMIQIGHLILPGKSQNLHFEK
jgi:hypothetical protein